MYEPKPIHRDAIPAALEKATRYRLLNEPLEAESICRDVLALDPDNQEALATLLLALTDQFEERLSVAYPRAREVLERIEGDYERWYYSGIVHERRAKAQMRAGGPRSGYAAYEWFLQAMDCFERAEAVRPPGNDDAILRWNTCARILASHPELEPPPEEPFQPLVELE